MFVELKTKSGSVARRTVRTESEAATVAKQIADRFCTTVTVFQIRQRDGKRSFIRKVEGS